MVQNIIAVDAMGGDHGPAVTLPACLQVLKHTPSLQLILVGDEGVIAPVVSGWGDIAKRVRVQHASQVVEMTDPVQTAMRVKKDSSMRVALNLVKSGEAQACISAGNTGALMALSRFVLKTAEGVDRPAIVTALPTMKGHVHVLDLGANVDSSDEHLVQFARMGSLLSQAIDGNNRPRVALLNIGEEEIKGNESIKAAALALKADAELNYVGFIEGDGIFRGEADVVVCDGFVGNVMLKTTEGTARMITTMIKEQINRSWLTRFLALFSLPIWKGLKDELNPSRYNGASLIGLRGIVVKSHGGTDVLGFANALELTVHEVAKDIPGLIAQNMVKHQPQGITGG